MAVGDAEMTMYPTVNHDGASATVAQQETKVFAFPDPLAADAPDDELVLTTRRALVRIALVASETGARFQRDALDHDSMAWMLAPRALFDGRAPIDACQDVESCRRGVLLHALGHSLDAERDFIDYLLSGDDDFDDHGFRYRYGEQALPGRDGGRRRRVPKMRMYTATIVETRDNRMMQVFHASIARDAEEVRTRLAGRFGPDVAALADIRLGVHVASPPVVALVPQAVVDLIRRMERACVEPGARTFAVDIEMGIQA